MCFRGISYRVGDPTHNAWSPIHRFSTMDPHQTEVRIATFGDMYVRLHSSQPCGHHTSRFPAHRGDLSFSFHFEGEL